MTTFTTTTNTRAEITTAGAALITTRTLWLCHDNGNREEIQTSTVRTLPAGWTDEDHARAGARADRARIAHADTIARAGA